MHKLLKCKKSGYMLFKYAFIAHLSTSKDRKTILIDDVSLVSHVKVISPPKLNNIYHG